MSLVPSGQQALTTLDSIRNALRPLKAALDERDGWEVLAAQDEAGRVAALQSSLQQGSSKAVRVLKGSKTRRSSGNAKLSSGSDVKPRIPKNLGRQLFVTHCILNVNIVTSASIAVFANHTVTQGTDPNSSQYAGCFDCFWILKVRWTYRSQQAPGSLVQLPTVLIAKEYTGGVPSTLNAIQGYESVKEKCLCPGQSISLTAEPRFQSTAGTVAGGEASVGWLNAALSSAVPWSGCVIGVSSTPGGVLSLQGQLDMWTAYSNGD